MKNLYLIFVFFSSFSLYSQGEYNVQFSLFGVSDIPIKSQMPKMGVNYGLGMYVAYKPINRIPVFLELKGNLGMYDYRTSTETFIFDDNSTTVTDVSFKSSMHKLQFGTKIYVTNFYSRMRGYVTPQIGYNFMRSRIRVADPLDEDDCQPLENRIAHKSGGLTYGAEIGFELDVIRLIKIDGFTNSRLFMSLSYLGSFNKVDYINTKYMNENVHGVYEGGHQHHEVSADRDVTLEFINVSNNSLHEHKIAEVYKTPLRYFNINLGYVWYF